MGWLSRILGRKPVVSARDGASPYRGKDVQLREGSPEFDLFIAQATLDVGENLPHGAQHLANLLQLDPARAEWRALVDRYVVAARPDIDSLVPDQEPRHASSEALRAYLWQLQGRTEDGVLRLVDVTRAIGRADYLHAWALGWLEPEGAIEALPERTALLLFGAVLTTCPEAQVSSASTHRAIRRWVALIERAAPRYEASGLLTMMHAGLLRKAGMLDEALAVAGPIEQATEFNRAVAVGLALRAKGLHEASAQAFDKAITLAPDETSGYLEAGDSLLEAQHWPQALQHYDSALKIEPGNAWAEASAWYCQWKMSGDENWMDRLIEAANTGRHRAHELAFRERGALPESGDASANVLRQLRTKWLEQGQPAQPRKDEKITLGLSTLEAPSNRLAILLELAAFGHPAAALQVSVSSIPAADPRVPLEAVRHVLWRFDGTDPHPALPPPSQEVSNRIATLAAERYDPHTNWARASHVAQALGVERLTEILAVMVHPPAAPSGVAALAWLPRLQLAAAQVAGQIDEGWIGSARREALMSVLYGPWDWTTCAAIRVLAWIAREEPAHATDIHQAFERLEKHVPSEGHWDWIDVLYQHWQTIPCLFDTEREALRAKREALAG